MQLDTSDVSLVGIVCQSGVEYGSGYVTASGAGYADEYGATEKGGWLVRNWYVYGCDNMRSSAGGVLYEDSEDDGEGNSWHGDRCGGCSSAGFCSREAGVEAARRSCSSISMAFQAVRGMVAQELTRYSILSLSFLRWLR
jgi:hypothetical protein